MNGRPPQTPNLPHPVLPHPPSLPRTPLRASHPAPCLAPAPMPRPPPPVPRPLPRASPHLPRALPPLPHASCPQSPDALVEEDSCPEPIREVRTLVEMGGPSLEGEEDPNKGLREEIQVESLNKVLVVALRGPKHGGQVEVSLPFLYDRLGARPPCPEGIRGRNSE